MNIVKRDPILAEVERQIGWLYDNLVSVTPVCSSVLKRSLSYLLFISTCKYASSLTLEQYRCISAARSRYKAVYLKPMNLLMASVLSFVENFCEVGIARRSYEANNQSVPRETLEEIIDFPSDFGAEIQKAADEIFETEKDVYVLKRLLRERDAILRLRHSRLQLLLQNREDQNV